MFYKIIFYLAILMPLKVRKVFLSFIVDFFINKYADIKVNDIQKIPKDSQVIFICNHLSNADGLIMYSVLKKIKKVFFVAGVKLKGETITRLVLDIIPHISIQPNKPDRKAIREAVKAVKGGNSLFVFPEGTRSRTKKLLKGRSGVVLISKQSQVPVIPIGLWGTENLLPVNEEGNMSNEWFRKAEVNISFGEPFFLTELSEEEELIDQMMKKIAILIPEEYRGVYETKMPQN